MLCNYHLEKISGKFWAVSYTGKYRIIKAWNGYQLYRHDDFIGTFALLTDAVFTARRMNNKHYMTGWNEQVNSVKRAHRNGPEKYIPFLYSYLSRNEYDREFIEDILKTRDLAEMISKYENSDTATRDYFIDVVDEVDFIDRLNKDYFSA